MQEGMYTATEYREPALEPGMAYQGPIETLIGTYTEERDAIEAAAAAMTGPLPAQVPLYGDGHAADRMIDAMIAWHQQKEQQR